MERFRSWEMALIAACAAVSSISVVHEPKLIFVFILIIGIAAIHIAARATLVALLFIVLSVGGATLSILTGIAGGATMLSALVLACVFSVGVAMGFRRPPIPAIVVVSIFFLWGAVWVVLPDKTGRSAVDWVGSTVSYTIPWLILAINWEKISTRFVATMVAVAPLIAVLVGFGLDVAGIQDMFNMDAIGTIRLAGGLPAAYMGSLAGFGMIAAMWLWLRRERPGLLLFVLDGLVLAGTLTRGPLLLASLVILALTLFTKRTRSRIAVLARFAFLLIFSAGLATVLPGVLARTQGQDDYQGGLSGRELAWDYFWQRHLERPLFGYGPGAHATLSQESSVALVREYFVAPHNTYLQLLVDFGLFGTAAILVSMIWLLLAVARQQERTERVLLSSMGFAMAIYAYFDNVLSVPQIYIPAFTLIGIVRVTGKRRRKSACITKQRGAPPRLGSPSHSESAFRARARL